MQRRPDDDTPVVSEFASTEPADALTDEVGGSAPHRWATRWPWLHGRTIVIVPLTASASAGATRVSIVWRAPCTGPQPPLALRVSSRRVGGTGTNDSPDEVAVAGRHVGLHADRAGGRGRHVRRSGHGLTGAEVHVRHTRGHPAGRRPQPTRCGGAGDGED